MHYLQSSLIVIARQPKFQRLWALIHIHIHRHFNNFRRVWSGSRAAAFSQGGERDSSFWQRFWKLLIKHCWWTPKPNLSIFWKGLHPMSQEVFKQLLRVRHAPFHAQSCPRLRGSANSFWRRIHIICKRCCTGQFLLTRGRPKKMVQIIFYNSSWLSSS